MCFGFSSAPRILSKSMKPVFAYLHSLSYECSYYLDDSLHINCTAESLTPQIQVTLQFFARLGLVVNFEKSVLKPTQVIRHLGFIIDSRDMTVSLPRDKIVKIVNFLSLLVSKETCSIRELARGIGLIVSTFLAVGAGKRHYRRLEILKTAALHLNCGNFEAMLTLTDQARSELQWWINNLPKTHSRSFKPQKILAVITTDASSTAWGAHLNAPAHNLRGTFDALQLNKHINVKELLAIKLAVVQFSTCLDWSDCTIKIRSDNTTALAYIKH